MSNKISKTGWLVIAILIAVSATIVIWPELATHPGHIILEQGGDAAKNYYTYLYHSLYGHGVWFRGMNYPYGEHILYTDGQPILSLPMSYLRQYIPMDMHTVLATMHIAMLVSFALGILYTYKVLIHFKISHGLAIAFSVLILLLSPQIFRVFVHFGLSHACVIPMLFFWSAKYYATDRVRYVVYIFLLGCIMSFAHPYFAGLVLMWGLFYAMGVMLDVKRRLKSRLKQAIYMALSVIAVAIIFKAVMYMTDPVKDRPTYPTGILSSCTTGSDIFTSPHSPIWSVLKEKRIVEQVTDGGEGHSYMGLVCIIMVFLGVGGVLLRWVRRKQNIETNRDEHVFPAAFLFIAFFAILLSMGVPFVWGMESLLDYVSAFRQFRTLGRFSWIWYYILSVYAVVVLHSYYTGYLNRGKKVAANALLIPAMLIWGYEASGYKGYINKRCSTASENYAAIFSQRQMSWDKKLHSYGYEPSDFQAILSLPYYHLGSEKLWQFYDEVAWLQVLTCRASLQLGLPYANAFMSRSSWGQTFSQIKIQGGPLVDKELLQGKDDRPFLVFVRVTDSLTDPDQRYILDACEYIGEKEDDMKAYRLYPSALRAKDSTYRAMIQGKYDVMPVGDTVFNNNSFCCFNHFDNKVSEHSFWGAGALMAIKGEYQILADVAVPAIDTGQSYEFSAWVLLSEKDYKSPYFDVECYGKDGLMSTYMVHTHRAQDTRGMWVRASKYFKIPNGCNRIRCVLFNRPKRSYIAVDEVMIRAEKSIIISKQKGKCMVNNHVFTPVHTAQIP